MLIARFSSGRELRLSVARLSVNSLGGGVNMHIAHRGFEYIKLHHSTRILREDLRGFVSLLLFSCVNLAVYNLNN